MICGWEVWSHTGHAFSQESQCCTHLRTQGLRKAGEYCHYYSITHVVLGIWHPSVL